MNKQAELISIGNELLSGRTLNAHAQTLGGALSAIGLRLVRDTTIPDEIPTIGTTVLEALSRTNLVFVSGGLGPTVDDITREAIAQVLGCGITVDQASVAAMAKRYAARGRTMTPAAERQAQILTRAAVLPNPVGAAPGQRMDLDEGRILFILPGPPHEFKAILEEEIVPWLRKRFPNARPDLVRVFCTEGIGESDIVTILEREKFQPLEVDLGFYPAHGKVEIRLTAPPKNTSQIESALKTLQMLLGDFIPNGGNGS